MCTTWAVQSSYRLEFGQHRFIGAKSEALHEFEKLGAAKGLERRRARGVPDVACRGVTFQARFLDLWK